MSSPDEERDGPSAEPALVMREEGLTLVAGSLELRGDFARMLPRLRPQNLRRELLVRASKIKGVTAAPMAVDATAGLGEDALLLAAAGFELLLFERDATIAALLRDAMERACAVPELAPLMERMRLVEKDSIRALAELAEPPDLMYLDPMFPARKKSAAIKKKLQLLQLLERPSEDEEALLGAALASGARKVVVKRPAKGPYLAGAKPSHTLVGKAVRYDCYALAR